MNNPIIQIVLYKIHLLLVFWIYTGLKYLKIIGMIQCFLFIEKENFVNIVLNNYVSIIVMKNYNNYLLNLYLNKNRKNMNEKI
jgi:hypothetical protein